MFKHEENLVEDVFSDRMLFVKVDLSEQSKNNKFIKSYLEDILGQEEIENNQCHILMVKHKNNSVFKHILKDAEKFNAQEMKEFVENSLMNKEEKYFKSERIP